MDSIDQRQQTGLMLLEEFKAAAARQIADLLDELAATRVRLRRVSAELEEALAALEAESSTLMTTPAGDAADPGEDAPADEDG